MTTKQTQTDKTVSYVNNDDKQNIIFMALVQMHFMKERKLRSWNITETEETSLLEERMHAHTNNRKGQEIYCTKAEEIMIITAEKKINQEDEPEQYSHQSQEWAED